MIVAQQDICIICGKKVKISAIECKCKQPLCNVHVNELNHDCTYDYKEQGKNLIIKNNPKIISSKIQ